MRITQTQENLLIKCAEYLTPGQVVSLGFGLPGELPMALAGKYPYVFLTSSGLVGDWENAGSPSDFIDGNKNHVKLRPGSSVLGFGERASLITGGYVEAVVIEPKSLDRQGRWTPVSSDVGDLLSLMNHSERLIGLLELENQLDKFVDSLSEDVCSPRKMDKIITDMCVLSVTDQGLIVDEIRKDYDANDIKNKLGADVLISESCRFYDPLSFNKGGNSKISKVYKNGRSAVSDISDGSVVMIDGFAGPGGMAHYLLVSLRDQGAKNLTIISNTAGIARVVNFGTPPGKLVIDHSILIDNGQVGKAIASYPVSPSASNPSSFELAYRAGEVDLELVPQGTLAERLRAGGAGVKCFYTPTGAGTLIAEGKNAYNLDGKEYVEESGLIADYCIIRGYKADRFGNVVYKGTSRNFNSVMAPAAKISIVEVDEIVDDGALDPELIVTPGVFVDRIVVRPSDFSPYE